MRVLPAVLGLLLLSPTLVGAARTVVATGEPVTVHLAPRQPTAVTFPESIAAVPTGADPHQLSLELDGPRLFLQPLDPAVSGLLFAIGVSGRSYALRFAVGVPADTEVVVTLPAAPRATSALATPDAIRSGGTWRELLRAMLLGTQPPGTTVAPVHQDLGTVDGLRLTAVHIYTMGGVSGYIAEVTNPTENPQPLRVQAVTTPGLLAITAETDTVPARGTTRLYLVVRAGAQ